MNRMSPIFQPPMNRVRAEKIGFIFQHFHLIPYLRAVENVMLAQYFHSMTDEKEALVGTGTGGAEGTCAPRSVAAIRRRTATGVYRSGADQRPENYSGG